MLLKILQKYSCMSQSVEEGSEIVGMQLLEPGLNFINVLQAAFEHADPKFVKVTVKLSIFFHFWYLQA
jgi:hypothetical protein